MANVKELTLNDLTQQDIYYAIRYLAVLGFDLDKNSARDLLISLVELKQIALQDNTTIKSLYQKENNSTLN